MTGALDRRGFLKLSAALAAGSAAGFSCIEVARAAPVEVPTVDTLSLRVLIDSAHDQFLKPATVQGVRHQPPGNGRGADYRKVLHNQWGLSLFAESKAGEEARTVLLDFGYSPEALLNNIEILKVDPTKVDALIVSHGHHDHYGGLTGFLDSYRDRLSPELKLYAGGEDNFCHRLSPSGVQGQFTDFGQLDRRELTARRISTVLCEAPTVIAGHAFTTGRSNAPRRSASCPTPSSSAASRTGSAAMPATIRRPSCRGRSSRTSTSTSTPPATTCAARASW